ncbi:cobalamin biosynthesis protein [Ochrobactrum phage vB_OspM_OC]|nr:cobalamin biosynthesis protein [Ochrobactrum phage vB_OspM_OC]
MAKLENVTTGRIYPMPNVGRLNILAELVTEKQLRLRLDENAPTAYVDLKNSDIVIPYWDVPDGMFRMLVGHESAHVIWTSYEEFMKRLEANKNVSQMWNNILSSVHNVCEDVRIDKKIQHRLPGMRADYKVAAGIIRESPLFNPEKAEKGIIAKSIKDAEKVTNEQSEEQKKFNESFRKMMEFLNAANIFYKSRWDGKSTKPTFKETAETDFFERMDRTVTEDHVYTLSEDIMKHFLDEQYAKDKQRDKEQMTKFLKQLLDMLSSDSANKINVNSKGGAQVGSGDGKAIDESDLDDEAKEILKKIKEKMAQAAKDQAEQDQQQKGTNSGPGSGYKQGDVSVGTGGSEGSSPSHALDTNNTSSGHVTTGTVGGNNHYGHATGIARPQGQYDPTKIYIPAKHVANHFRRFANNVKDDIRHNVSSLVRGFELNKKSEEYHKTQTAKTGKINPRELHAYKVSEDIFKHSEIEYTGDKYGFFIFLDYSGSMSDKVLKVTEHAYIMSMFFKRVGVPFKFFSVGLTINNMKTGNRTIANHFKSGWGGGYNVYELFSSDLKKSEINQVYNGMMSGLKDGGVSLGGTPLTNTLLTARYVADSFIEGNDIKKFGVIAITDGGDELGSVGGLQDNKTGKLFSSTTQAYYGHTIKLYKELFNAAFIAIDLEKTHSEGVESEYTKHYNLSRKVIQNRPEYLKFAKDLMKAIL